MNIIGDFDWSLEAILSIKMINNNQRVILFF
jgi:hypothetical protein